MATCDLCGKHASASSMADLRPCYRTAGIVDICPDCQKWASKRKDAYMFRLSEKLLRRDIRERARIYRLPWWRRLFVTKEKEEGHAR